MRNAVTSQLVSHDLSGFTTLISQQTLEEPFSSSPEEGFHFAPGYYSILFGDPDGIRVEFNYVPGKGHFGDS